MNLDQAIRLIHFPRGADVKPTTWADLGAGKGLFTHALASLLSPGSKITAVDKQFMFDDREIAVAGIRIEKLRSDFVTDRLALENLDGLLMANSLHFVEDKISFLKTISGHLKENAVILIVEYDTETANRWVPYPIGFENLKIIFAKLFGATARMIAQTPSRYNKAMIYGAWIPIDPKPIH